MIIYQIENKLNDKIYIGQTKRRLKSRLRGHMKSKSYIGCALRKYGLENFNIQIIDYAETKEELNEKEKYWIKTLDCKDPNGYNLTDGGDGLLNPSEETLFRLSQSHIGIHKGRVSPTKGMKYTAETKQKMSESGKGNPHPKAKGRVVWNKGLKGAQKGSMLGKKHTEESKIKMSESLTGKIPWNKGLKGACSEETRMKMSISAKNRDPISEETRMKIGENSKKFWENKRTLEENISL